MFQAGQPIGIYTLIEQIGRGAVGEVWLAERRGLVTTKVAVKLPREENIDIEAVRREAELWACVSGHPNVLPIIEADIYDGQVIIVSEYARDGSLRKLLREHTNLPVNQSIEVISGILRGLEQLHFHQIIHRDLKPENILLQGDTPRLTDFGISRMISAPVSQDTAITGTPNYMAPEAFDGKRNICTDIWSAGVIFYELLAGRKPFPQKQTTELMGAIVFREYPPLPDYVPPRVQEIVAKALAKSPPERYQNVREMLNDLRDFSRAFQMTEDAELSRPQTIAKKIPAAEDSPYKTSIVNRIANDAQIIETKAVSEPQTGDVSTSGKRNLLRFALPILILVIGGGIGFFVLQQTKIAPNSAAQSDSAAASSNNNSINRASSENASANRVNSEPTIDDWIEKGNEQHRRRDFDAAISAYTKAIEIKPDYSPVYNNRGVAYGDKGDYKKALADFRKALELDPQNNTAKINFNNLRKIQR